MSEHERDETIALYALGLLPPDEAAAAAALIDTDPAARAAYAELSGAVDAVAVAAEEPLAPARSARMRERLLAEIGASRAAARPPRRSAGLTWGFGLAAAAALAFAFVSLFQNVALRAELAAQQARTDRIVADISAPDARRYAVNDGAIVVRGTRIYLALSRLPAPPAGHVYQVWTLPRGSKVVQPSVTFAPDRNGTAIVPLPVDAGTVGGIAVNIEPVGGSTAPTTKPIFLRPLT